MLIHLISSAFASGIPERRQCVLPMDPSDCEQFLRGSGEQFDRNDPTQCTRFADSTECYLYEVNNGLREPIPDSKPTIREYAITYLGLGSAVAFLVGELLGVFVTIVAILGVYWLKPSERLVGLGVAAATFFAAIISGIFAIQMLGITAGVLYFSGGIP